MALQRIVSVAGPARIGASSVRTGFVNIALHLLDIIEPPVTAPPQLPLSEAKIVAVPARVEVAFGSG